MGLTKKWQFNGLFLSIFLAIGLLAMVWQTISAQGSDNLPPILTGSDKQVSRETAPAGATLHYTIVISNSGTPATNVTMDDTLPAELTYVPGSLSVNGGGLYGATNNIITWTGSINSNNEVILTFQADLDDSLPEGLVITNTAVISTSGAAINRTATTTIVELDYTTAYLPFASVPYPLPATPVLSPLRSTSSGDITLNWTVDQTNYLTGFEIEESLDDPTFAAPTLISLGNVNTWSTTKSPTFTDDHYYYRVRGVGPGGPGQWSNIELVRTVYRDDFGNSASGWAIRRQDTDTVVNTLTYVNNHLALRIGSQLDYAIASPLVAAPTPPYRIETSVYWNLPGYQNSYGLIFGGDWNGTTCPNNNYSSCFNHYYRLNVIYFEVNTQLRFQLKRIDYHEPSNNTGGGIELIPYTNVQVNPPAYGYQVWAIEVSANGLIKVYVNGNLVGSVTDTTYIANPYFGIFSSSDIYKAVEPRYDWYLVSPLP